MKPQTGVGESRKKMLKAALLMQGGFLFGGMRMDKLQECAYAFEKLLNTQYHIIIGRKGKAVDLRICFEAVDFHHLLGLHKLSDNRVSRGNREKVFADILSGKLALSGIEKSRYFDKVQNRLDYFVDIESIFDKNSLIFRYNQKAHVFTLIKAEYLISTPHKATDVYVFLDRKDIREEFFCRSFFPKETRDYTIGQPAYTLLFKEKINLTTNQAEIQYDRLSPVLKNELTVTASAKDMKFPESSMKERFVEAQIQADRHNSARAAGRSLHKDNKQQEH